MTILTIIAEVNFDLKEAYDRILDGELDTYVDPESLDALQERAPVFGAGDGRVPKISITLKKTLNDQEKAELMAKLRGMFGSSAHIHMDA